MKKILIFAFIVSYFVGSAQNLELLYKGNIVEDTLEIDVENVLIRNDIYIDIVNHSTRPINVKVRKTELSILEETENSFCFGIFCYDSYESPTAFTISAQDTFSQATDGAEAFHIAYSPYNQIGISYIRYTFFNEQFPEDSTSFVAKLVTTPTSNIKTITESPLVIYPNPSDRDYVIFSFNNREENSLIFSICNTNGQILYSRSISQGTNYEKIDITGFPAGMYFGTLMANGRVYSSQKFIIQ